MLSGLLYLACQMLDRTCNSVGHGRETEVGGGIMAIRGEIGNYKPTWMSFLLNHVRLPMNGIV